MRTISIYKTRLNPEKFLREPRSAVSPVKFEVFVAVNTVNSSFDQDGSLEPAGGFYERGQSLSVLTH